MKLSRQLLREMILEEVASGSSVQPDDVASSMIKTHGELGLSKMTDAEVENAIYTLMSEMDVLGDDWPEFLDSVIDILGIAGAGQGQSVMGTSI